MTQFKPYRVAIGVLSAALLTTVAAGPVFAGMGQNGHPSKVAVLDLDALTSKILKTDGIGMFAKLSLQTRFTDLLDDISLFHQGRSVQTRSQLKNRFNVIILKVIGLLREGDPDLHNELVSSRDVIWQAINQQKSVLN